MRRIAMRLIGTLRRILGRGNQSDVQNVELGLRRMKGVII